MADTPMPDTEDQRSDSGTDELVASVEHRQMVCVLGRCRVSEAEAGSAAAPARLSVIQRTILARLAMARPDAVGTDELAYAVWGDEPPATARTSIHNQISRIRGRLGVDSIVTDDGHYALTLPTDCEAVADALPRAERLVARSRFTEAIELIQAELERWSGVPFDELGELSAVQHERLHLTEVMRSFETLRLEAAIGDGRLSSAIPEAERLVADNPDDEHRWVLLIRSLELAGRRGDALGAYERARRTLVRTLGIAPGPELRAAEAAVLDTAAAERISGPAPLVGRVDVIHSALARCDTGESVVLVGESGIGKSRVLEHLWRHLRRGEATVATSVCSLNADTAVETLRELAEGLDIVLDPVRPPVAAFNSALTELVDSGTEVVLIVDDLDRAGPTSTAALCSVAEIDGVVLLGTATDTALLPRDLAAETLVVEPLDTDEMRALADFLLGEQEPVDQAKLAWLLEMSGGNPAILEHMLEAPVWPDRIDGSDPAGNGGPAPSEALRQVARRRLDGVAATTRAALEVAAVCAPGCPSDVLEELTPDHGIPGGIAAGLLIETEDDDGRRRVSFRHGAVRRILYDDLSPGRRMEIHHRAAGLLRAEGASAASVAAHSLASAEVDPLAATEDAFAAAESATRDGAHSDAAQWYGRALTAIERTGADERLRVAALIGVADSLRQAGAPEQEDTLFAAADAAFEWGDDHLIGEAAFAVLQLGAARTRHRPGRAGPRRGGRTRPAGAHRSGGEPHPLDGRRLRAVPGVVPGSGVDRRIACSASQCAALRLSRARTSARPGAARADHRRSERAGTGC